jgi:hypothetical protein
VRLCVLLLLLCLLLCRRGWGVVALAPGHQTRRDVFPHVFPTDGALADHTVVGMQVLVPGINTMVHLGKGGHGLPPHLVVVVVAVHVVFVLFVAFVLGALFTTGPKHFVQRGNFPVFQFFNFSTHGTVPMVFNGVVRPSRQQFRNLGPPVAQSFVGLHDDAVFARCPCWCTGANVPTATAKNVSGEERRNDGKEERRQRRHEQEEQEEQQEEQQEEEQDNHAKGPTKRPARATNDTGRTGPGTAHVRPCSLLCLPSPPPTTTTTPPQLSSYKRLF